MKYSSHPITTRSVELQVGRSQLQQRESTRQSKVHTPKKPKLPPKVKCNNLPSSSSSVPKKSTKRLVVNVKFALSFGNLHKMLSIAKQTVSAKQHGLDVMLPVLPTGLMQIVQSY